MSDGPVDERVDGRADGLAERGDGYDTPGGRAGTTVRGWSPEQYDDFMAGVEDVAAKLDLPLPLPASSLIGVACLFEPDVRVEIEATA